MRILSGAIAMQQYMYVEEDQRSKWEAFAKANEAWVQETIEIQRGDTTLGFELDIPDYDTNHSTSIRYGQDPVAYNTGPYTPTWLTYPILPSGNSSAYNFNAIQHKLLGPGIQRAFESHKVVIGPVLNFEDSKEDWGENKVSQWASRYVPKDEDTSEPIIRILYPILDTEEGALTIDQPHSNVVGIIASSFFWRDFLENILPNGERGLVVVFENTCNQSFTYELSGKEAQWLGPGDLHDPQFNDYAISKKFEEIDLFSVDIGIYGGLPIDEEFCAYTVSTYPSQRMKDTHITDAPLIYASISVAIFVFTSLFFLGYDKLVSKRQEKVIMTAARSTKIVSSLFPSNIRDRLLNADEYPTRATKTGKSFMFEPTKTRLRTFLNDGESPNESKSKKTHR